MTTSGVSVFSVTMSSIIYDAFQRAEIISAGVTLDAADYDIAKRDLNKMIKAWQARGLGLWLNQQVVLPLAKGQTSYLLGPTGSNCTALSGFGETTIKTAGLAGAGTIEVDSIAGMSTTQYIGIQLDDGTMQWTTINGAPAGTTVTLTAALTDTVTVGNVVFFYTTKINRPMEIIKGEVRLQDKNGIENPLELISLQEYRAGLSLKSSTGKPSQVAYDPQMINGVFYVWETAVDVSDRILMTVKRPIYDFVNDTDEPDFPIEWADALEKNLAYQIAPKFHVPPQKKAELKVDAKESYDEADWHDRENTYIYFTPSYE